MRSSSLLCAPLALLVTVSSPGLAAAEPTTEQAAVKWAEMRAETVRVESDWRWQEGVLRGTQEALRQRVQELERARDTLRELTAPTRRELQQLAEDNAVRRQTLAALEERLRVLTERVLHLRHQLPPRLALALELPLRSLADPDLPIAQRAQHLATVESRCAEFNRVITSQEELIGMSPDEAPRLLSVLYWGLARGYALDREGGRAYVGAPGAAGWQWQPHPDLAPALERLLAMHRDEAAPEFVALPLQVNSLAPRTP